MSTGLKILLVPHTLVAPLTDDHVEQIVAAAGDAEVVVGRDEESLQHHAKDADVMFGRIRNDLLGLAENLKWVHSAGAGVDHFADLLGPDVRLSSGSGVVGPHLAEHSLALLFAITRGIAESVRDPSWSRRANVRDAQWELTDRTICIVGLGGSGRALASRARGLEFERIVAVDPVQTADDSVDEVVTPEEIDRVLPEADVVALTLPMTPSTKGMFNAERFNLMKRGSIILNVSRGGLIDEDAMLEALKSGQLGGAGLDVTIEEPLPPEHPFLYLPNVVITPHIAGGSPRRAGRVVDQFCENLGRFTRGDQLLNQYDAGRGF
jgi:phosphoglycerate dehydrogenase-like enzyme